MEIFITRREPEIAYVLWQVRSRLTNGLIEPGMVCDQCNRVLDWAPFAVIDFPSDEQLSDPEYKPGGSCTLCRTCARRFYNLTSNDIGKVHRLWFFYDAKRLR